LDLRGRKWQEAGEHFVMRSFHNLHASPNIVKVIKSMGMRWEGACSTHGRDVKCMQKLVGKTEGKSTQKIILEWIIGK
jgi:hypothetical protein